MTPGVEQRLAVAQLALERDARRRSALFGELVQGPVTPGLRRRALAMGWELDGWHTGIQMDAADEVEHSQRRSEVIAAFAAEGVDIDVVEVSDGWAAWVTSATEPTAEEVQQTATAIRRAHRQLEQTLGVATGIGRPHPATEGIGRSLAEAADAARLAQGRPESGRFMHVDRLGLAQLLLAWTRTDTFQPAARSLLQPLVDASSDLVPTLSAYLDAESSLAETAAVLGVHRNTVAARIKRVEMLLRVELANPDERLALHLACRTAMTQSEPRS